MKYLLLFLVAFFSGSIPFSYIFGKLFLKVDIRDLEIKTQEQLMHSGQEDFGLGSCRFFSTTLKGQCLFI